MCTLITINLVKCGFYVYYREFLNINPKKGSKRGKTAKRRLSDIDAAVRKLQNHINKFMHQWSVL